MAGARALAMDPGDPDDDACVLSRAFSRIDRARRQARCF
jgi:hypothetical protein